MALALLCWPLALQQTNPGSFATEARSRTAKGSSQDLWRQGLGAGRFHCLCVFLAEAHHKGNSDSGGGETASKPHVKGMDSGEDGELEPLL